MLNHNLVSPHNPTSLITESATIQSPVAPTNQKTNNVKFMFLFLLATHLFDQQLFATFAFINPVLFRPLYNILLVHTEGCFPVCKSLSD